MAWGIEENDSMEEKKKKKKNILGTPPREAGSTKVGFTAMYIRHSLLNPVQKRVPLQLESYAKVCLVNAVPRTASVWSAPGISNHYP